LNEENILAGKRLDMMLDLAKELLNDVQTAIYQLADDRVKELSVPIFYGWLVMIVRICASFLRRI
jgi:hypothetical protein